MVTGQSVGIDTSEDSLDVYLHPIEREVRLPHNDEGTASLLAILRGFDIERVVLESTGGSSGGWCGRSRRPVPP